jgi:hypothetical protein
MNPLAFEDCEIQKAKVNHRLSLTKVPVPYGKAAALEIFKLRGSLIAGVQRGKTANRPGPRGLR